MPTNLKTAAERFMRGVYGNDPSVVDELATADIIISYPVFQNVFGTPAIRGREAAKKFVERFASKWADGRITIDEAVSEGNSVVLIWSFRARNVGSLGPDAPPTNEEHSWGGITLYRFNEAGKITEETGEESAPGPIQRLADGGTQG